MISCSKRGASVEHKAVSLFIDAGFEVFLNAAPDGPADLVVWDGENTYLVDTKKLTRYVRKDGTTGHNRPTQTNGGVYHLGWCSYDGWIWLSEPPEALSNVF